MKVLVVSNLYPPDFIGGYELGCSRIAEALAALGHEVTVATSRSALPDDAESIAASPSRVRVHRVFHPVRSLFLDGERGAPAARDPRWCSLMALADLDNAEQLRELLARVEPDRIYAFNWVGLGPLGIMEVLVGSGLPVVMHLMDHLDLVLGGILGAPGLIARLARLKSGSTAIACSRLCLESNHRLGAYGQSSVIFSGVEPAALPSGRGPGAVAFRFVCTGQVSPHKGIRVLLDAFRRTRSSVRRPIELHLVGRVMAGALDDDAARDRDVRIHGPMSRDETLRFLPGMDAGVYPLQANEAFGYAAVECMAAGIPVILPRLSGAAEIFPPHYPLFVEDRLSSEEIAAHMIRLVREPECGFAACRAFDPIRREFGFENYTLPAIAAVLHRARAMHAPRPWSEIRREISAMSRSAATMPEWVFRPLG